MGPKNKGAITRKADFGRTPLSDIFRGQLRSRVFRNTHDNNITDNVQPFFTLQLDIEVWTIIYCKCSFLVETFHSLPFCLGLQNSSSVKEALEAYVKRDQLEGVTCSRSNQEVMAWQEVQLEELPPVLLLHLKCFDYRHDGCSKIIKSIEYEINLKIDSSKAIYTRHMLLHCTPYHVLSYLLLFFQNSCHRRKLNPLLNSCISFLPVRPMLSYANNLNKLLTLSCCYFWTGFIMFSSFQLSIMMGKKPQRVIMLLMRSMWDTILGLDMTTVLLKCCQNIKCCTPALLVCPTSCITAVVTLWTDTKTFISETLSGP